MGRRLRRAAMAWTAVALAGAASSALADEPLHVRIDGAIEAKLNGPPAALSTDAEFVRRIWLDLAGMAPSVEDARAFLDDPSPYKRERLIDRLLGMPEFARAMQVLFDVTLMERRTGDKVPHKQWQEYLRKSFLENKPFNQLAAEIIATDGTEPEERPAARFALEREVEPNLLTRDVGRVFLGVDLQCAQCHDHPLIDDYKQAHYYGLFAFLSRTTMFNDEGRKQFVLGEKGDGDVTFTSVFKKKVSHSTGPRLFDAPEVAEPKFGKGDEYIIQPADKVRPVPKFSRRSALAKEFAKGAVPEFNRNIANRLWAHMMGRGLVQPLDLAHSENPPSHPELLDELGRDIAAMKFDVKAFLRELALSQTYQRTSEPPPGSSEDLADPAKFGVFPLKPLSPEQLAWSTMQATGLVTNARAGATQNLDGNDPRAKAIFQTDPKRQALRTEMIEVMTHQALEGGEPPFVQRFAAGPGQPQDGGDATVQQALFLANGQPVQSWLSTLVGRLNAQQDVNLLAEELYLSVLVRRPTAHERAEVAKYLGERGKERVQALQELAWALLASTEFRFNH